MFKDQIDTINNATMTPLEKQTANFALNVTLTHAIWELTERLKEIDRFIEATDKDDELREINEPIMKIVRAEEKEITAALAAFATVYEESFGISA